MENNEEIIFKTLDNFESMSVEEQKMLLFILITSYIECLDGMKNTKSGSKEYEHWYYQKETYDFIMRLFVKPSKALTDNGVPSPKEFVLREARKQFDELNSRKVEA